MHDMLTRVSFEMTLSELGRTCNALTATADAYRATAHDVLGAMPSGSGEKMNRYWLARAVETEELRDRIREAWARGPMVGDDGPTAADEAEHDALIRQAVSPTLSPHVAARHYIEGSEPDQIEAE